MPFLRQLLGTAKGRFVVYSLALLLLTSWYAWWLWSRVLPESGGFLYTPTGKNNFWESIYGITGPVLLVCAFSSIALLTFAIIRLGTQSGSAFLGAILFVTTAQVGLVYMSAPFWDLMNFMPMLCGVALAFLIVTIPNWRRHIGRRLGVWVLAASGVGFFVAVTLRLQNQTIFPDVLGSSGVRLLEFALAIALVASIVIHFRLRFHKSDQPPHSEVVLLLALSAAMGAVIFVAPLFGRTSSSSSLLIFLVLALSPVFLNLNSRPWLGCVASAFLGACIVLSVYGGGSPGGRMTFYVTAGWQAAPQMAAGVTGNSVALGVPFSDGMIDAFLSAQPSDPLKYLGELVPMFLPTVVGYFSIGWHLLSQGVWSYPEPPVGADGPFWLVRGALVSALAPFALIASLMGPVILIRRHRRPGMLLLALLSAVMLMLAFSRPQGHQWWFLPIFGVWALVYAAGALVRWARSADGDRTGGVGGADSVRTTPRAHGLGRTARRLSGAVGVVLVASWALNFVGDAIGIPIGNVTRTVQMKAAERILGGYSTLPWVRATLVSKPNYGTPASRSSTVYALPSGTTIVRVSAAPGCTLEETQMELSGATVGAGPQRFFVGSTSTALAYLPVISPLHVEGRLLTISSVRQDCPAQVDVVNTPRGQVPVLAWLPNGPESLIPAGAASWASSRSPLERTEDTTVASGTNAAEPIPASTNVVTVPQGAAAGHQIARDLTFTGYVDAGQYRAVNPDAFKNEFLSTQVSARVLGTTDQGYMATDIWVSQPEIASTPSYIAVSGAATRGSVVVGIELGETANVQDVPLAKYEAYGSIFNQSSTNFVSCFPIPANLPYRVFVGVVTDRYGYSWTDMRIDSIVVDPKVCYSTPAGSRQWLPTLS